MPQKKITIPAPIMLVDPSTGAAIDAPEGVLEFEAFIGKLMTNPIWAESWKAGLAQQSIKAALASNTNGHLLLAEDDWAFLDAAAKHPRMTIYGHGGQSGVITGLGFHPSLAGQIVPMQLAIINAETV